MYKNLCTDGLGVSVRQNELIELALTYGFRGIEIDMDDMAGRAESMGHQFATQFVNSASVQVGTFELPIDFSATDEEFDKQMQRLELICELAKSIGASRCHLSISPEHAALPYVDNFEKHRTRISSVADKFAEINVVCGLKFTAGLPKKDGMQFIHKPEELQALVKTIDHPNVGMVVDTWHWQVAGEGIDQIKSLDLSNVTEVRLADPPEGFDSTDTDQMQRLTPGSHPQSLCQETLGWLKENEYDGPIGINAQVPKSTTNSGDNLFQRINKVFEEMLEGPAPLAEETSEEDSSDESNATVAAAD